MEYPNQRRHIRYPVRVGAEVQLPMAEFTCATKNLSLGGVGLDLDRQIPEGATVLVSLHLVIDDVEDEATEPLELVARVVWCHEVTPERYEAGLEFQEVSDSQHARLRHFLELQDQEVEP